MRHKSTVTASSRLVYVFLGVMLLGSTQGCALVTVQQDTFAPLDIRAERPAPPPARVVLEKSAIRILDKVQFEFDKADLLPESFALLDEVARVMVENSQLELVQIEGHTDSSGSLAHNRKLSQERAESVRTYLIGKGVAKSRLVAKGFGPDRPLADNATEPGRETNRRVDFQIVKQGPKRTVVQDE